MGRISRSYIKSFPTFALLSYYFVIIANNRMIRSVLSFLTWKHFYNAFAFAFCCLLDTKIGVCFILFISFGVLSSNMMSLLLAVYPTAPGSCMYGLPYHSSHELIEAEPNDIQSLLRCYIASSIPNSNPFIISLSDQRHYIIFYNL